MHGVEKTVQITMGSIKSCLNAIEQDLMQENYDDALILLNTLVCAAVREGYKEAAWNYAVWKDGEQLVGVRRTPLNEVYKQVDQSFVTISDDGVDIDC